MESLQSSSVKGSRNRAKVLRGRRWAQERVLSERLEREPTEKPWHAISVGASNRLGAVVDEHDNDEDGDTSQDDDGS